MAKKRAVAKKNSMPWGVQVISILNYVIFVVLLLSGLGFFFSAIAFSSSDDARMTVLKFFDDFTGSTTIATKLVGAFSTIMVFAGIIALLLAVLFFFLGRGIWNGKNWARIVTVVFFTLGFIGALADLLRGDFAGNIPEIVIDGLVAGYLLFNRRVRAFFS